MECSTEKSPDGRPDAIWFSNHIEPLKVCQIVTVWTTSLNGSDPGAATADKSGIKERNDSFITIIGGVFAG